MVGNASTLYCITVSSNTEDQSPSFVSRSVWLIRSCHSQKAFESESRSAYSGTVSGEVSLVIARLDIKKASDNNHREKKNRLPIA